MDCFRVPDAIIENIPQASSNSQLFISGLSMGGFGALRLGTKYSSRFSGISAHSSITSPDQLPLFVEEPLEGYEQSSKSSEDILDNMLRNKGSLPPIRFDCGKDDLLIEHNRTLHQKMKDEQIPHSYFEFPGKHEWSYWIKHLKDTLLFFDQILRKST
ncbi:alpha/beta hydrolase [Fulvivirga sp. M361]|uniref:alpha/beta hydrolase n=1 Tax=Fulvivirga sp. M361 TaxID=2594266 RepID=UPI00351AB18D